MMRKKSWLPTAFLMRYGKSRSGSLCGFTVHAVRQLMFVILMGTVCSLGKGMAVAKAFASVESAQTIACLQTDWLQAESEMGQEYEIE